MTENRRPNMHSPHNLPARMVLAMSLASLPWMLSACGRVDQAAAAPARPHVLIVVVDALRADRLGCYGYDRETTPVLDALARDPDAVIYKSHYVQGAYTKSSTASLFSGLFVFQHGVIHGNELVEIPGRPGFYPTQQLADEIDTMAERFDGLGYHTFAVVKSHHLDPEYGFAQGFDDYVDAGLHGDEPRLFRTVELIRSAIGPFFGYVHLNGVHNPFHPEHRDQAFMNRYGRDEHLTYDEQARVADGVDFTTIATRHALIDGEIVLEPDDVHFLNLVYDAKLRRADRMLEPLFQYLKDTGLYDDTLLIVTADHGEELYDHESYAHGHALWEEIIRVPLIVKFPRGGKPAGLGPPVTATTQAVDLLPALMAYMDQPVDGRLPGSDIFFGSPRGFAFAETDREWTLIHDGHKLIDGGGRTLLFERASDATDQVDLSLKRPDRVASMQLVAARLLQSVDLKPLDPVLEATKLSEQAIRDLRSLGYIR